MSKAHEHECEQLIWSNSPSGPDSTAYGSAVTSVYIEADGRMQVGNEEYGTYVNFCPFCGLEAERKI